MGLNAKKPPERGLNIVRQGVGQLIAGAAGEASPMAAAAPSQLNIAAPHPVYFVGLKDLAEGRLLSSASLIGWRYILLEGEQTIGAATVKIGEDDEQLQFSHISHGPFVQNTVEGIDRAENLPEVQSSEFELRLLDIPSLYVVSLWLHGNQDRLLPLPPTNRALEPYRSYSAEEMLAALRGPAIERLNSDDETPEPAGT